MDGGLVKVLKGPEASKLPALLMSEPWLRTNQGMGDLSTFTKARTANLSVSYGAIYPLAQRK